MNPFLLLLMRHQLTMKNQTYQNFQAMMMLMTAMRGSFLDAAADVALPDGGEATD